MRFAGILATLVLSAAYGKDYPFQPVPFTAVHLHDDFWAPKIETNRVVTIPFAFQKCEETGRVDNFDPGGQSATRRTRADKRKIPPVSVRRYRYL